jgi:(2Fe-2S) ferredoxin
MGKNIPKVTTTFQFCDGGSCQKAKSEIAIREARACIRNQGLWDETHTIKTRCNGRCEDAPTWIVQPGNFWYKNVTPEKAIAIVKSHTKDNTPVEDLLLYKEGWNTLATENEKTLAPPVFKSKTDPDHGDVLLARAFASDQQLYPLFQFLFETPRPVTVQYDGNFIEINTAHQVDYSQDFDVSVQGETLSVKLAIAALPKTISEDIIQRKVSVAEVIWLKKSAIFTKALRLKNKKGKQLMIIWIKEDDTATWEHLLQIYLAMAPNAIRIGTDEV